MRKFCCLLAAVLLLVGCAAVAPAGSPTATPEVSSVPEASAAPSPAATPAPTVPPPVYTPAPTIEPQEKQAGNAYIRGLAAAQAAALLQPGMSDYEKAKAAYDWMIVRTSFVAPIGLDSWQLYDDTPPSYLENRSLSVLRFGLGECEDYAAALALLLQEMGLQAVYVPGLTYSVSGALVDHAWTMVKLDGIWYHLDSQLEDNVVRDGVVHYRYFLRGDSSLIASHRWGANLLASGLLPPQQEAALRAEKELPACPLDHPTPPPQEIVQQPAADAAQLRAELAAEREAYEQQNGSLPEARLAVLPPVFGVEGFGPPDE